MSILGRIVADKREEVAAAKARLPLVELERIALAKSPRGGFAAALKRPGVSLIAEVKRASPSHGLIRADFDPATIATAYYSGGASAISVLTDQRYFQGSPEHLKQVCEAVPLPVLRKDFVIDPYQVFEARAWGASAVLLIVAILSPSELRSLMDLAHSLELATLVEVHEESEVDHALECGAQIIGINNRDLKHMVTDIAVTERLLPRLPKDIVRVSESGIATHAHVQQLREWGVDAILVGESLMRQPNIEAGVEALLGKRTSAAENRPAGQIPGMGA